MVDIVVFVTETVKVGDEFDATVTISQVPNFDAGQFDITIDKTMVELVSISDGGIGGTAIPVSLWHEVSPGVYRVIVNVPGVPGVSGSGSLAVMRCKALKAGNATFGISKGFINDNQAVEIAANWSGDSAVFFLRGDANGDGVVDTADITYIERIIVGLEAVKALADVNGDGQVNTADITTVERIIAGLALDRIFVEF